MDLSPGDKERLKTAMLKNRGLVLCGLLREIAAHNLDPDTKVRQLYKMRSCEPNERKSVLQEGFYAARIVRKLGDAALSKKLTNADLIDRVDLLIDLDMIRAEAVDRVSAKTLSGADEQDILADEAEAGDAPPPPEP
jgi:hypothetical protein